MRTGTGVFNADKQPLVSMTDTDSDFKAELISTVSKYKNSSRDEIANVNFYAMRPQATQIRWNNAK